LDLNVAVIMNEQYLYDLVYDSFYNRGYASGISSNPSPEKPSLLADLFKQSTTHYYKQSEFDVYLSEPVARHHSKFNVLDY